MPDPATSGTTAAAGILAALGGSGGIAGLIAWARRITGRVAAVEVKVDHVLEVVHEEKETREKSDNTLSHTMQRIIDARLEEQIRLYEKLEEIGKDQSSMSATLLGLKERLDRHNK